MRILSPALRCRLPIVVGALLLVATVWAGTILSLRGANFKVHWTLTEADKPDTATWEGRGPAHSYARTSYHLRAREGGGTRFDYENEFKAPGGFLGAAASRALMGGVPVREARRSLERLKAMLES
jgi:Polyketide cyclase / dehydrase and lipid transport